MKPFTLVVSALLANGLIATSSWAQTGKELDITMTIVDENDSPSAIINRIELPPVTGIALTTDASNASSLSASAALDALEQVQDDLQQTTGDLLNNTSEILTNSLNDTLSTGNLEQLPGDIIDNLPDDLPEDLLPLPGTELVPGELLNNRQAPLPELETGVDNTMDSALDALEQQPSQLPEELAPLPDNQLPLDDITNPLNP